MDWVRIIAERQIKEAIENGEFDNLPGKGKPIVLDDDAGIPPEMRAAVRIMKNARALPDWMLLQQEIEKEQAAITATKERGLRALEKAKNADLRGRVFARLRSDLLDRMDLVNTMLLKYALCCPQGYERPFHRYNLKRELAELDSAMATHD